MFCRIILLLVFRFSLLITKKQQFIFIDLTSKFFIQYKNIVSILFIYLTSPLTYLDVEWCCSIKTLVRSIFLSQTAEAQKETSYVFIYTFEMCRYYVDRRLRHESLLLSKYQFQRHIRKFDIKQCTIKLLKNSGNVCHIILGLSSSERESTSFPLLRNKKSPSLFPVACE